MSAYTTVYLSRGKALSLLYSQLGQLSDEKLERMLDDLLEDRLLRTSISGSGSDDNNVRLR